MVTLGFRIVSASLFGIDPYLAAIHEIPWNERLDSPSWSGWRAKSSHWPSIAHSTSINAAHDSSRSFGVIRTSFSLTPHVEYFMTRPPKAIPRKKPGDRERDLAKGAFDPVIKDRFPPYPANAPTHSVARTLSANRNMFDTGGRWRPEQTALVDDASRAALRSRTHNHAIAR